jgi:hypothetical protein
VEKKIKITPDLTNLSASSIQYIQFNSAELLRFISTFSSNSSNQVYFLLRRGKGGGVEEDRGREEVDVGHFRFAISQSRNSNGQWNDRPLRLLLKWVNLFKRMYTDRDLGFNRTGTVPIKASRERLSNG